MFGRLKGVVARVIQAYLPDPLVIVLLLTLFIFVLGVATEGSTPTEIVVYFGDRFWGLLVVAMQMTLVLVTATCLPRPRSFRRCCGACPGDDDTGNFLRTEVRLVPTS